MTHSTLLLSGEEVVHFLISPCLMLYLLFETE